MKYIAAVLIILIWIPVALVTLITIFPAIFLFSDTEFYSIPNIIIEKVFYSNDTRTDRT
jgi:sterol desaturase/sphingolipid hydroxylase (fatty acid hydroxylase superfamily)